MRPPSEALSPKTLADLDAANERVMAAGGIQWPASCNDWLSGLVWGMSPDP